MKIVTSLFFMLFALLCNVSAQNPYLPLWEFIPDGEPYVFEDPDNPGKYRVYIYTVRMICCASIIAAGTR